MGDRPDGEIAALAGVDRRCVVIFRHERGIPPCDFRRIQRLRNGPSRNEQPVRFRKSRLDAFRNLMGVLTDGEVAREAWVSREAVMRYRRRHHIEAAGRSPGPVLDETPLAVAPRAQDCAFLVTVVDGGSGHDMVVLAADLAEATVRVCSTLPSRYPGAKVQSVRYLCETL
jgi:hypothetical protein